MEPAPYRQPELSVNPEHEQEAERLQHGINALNLFDEIDDEEARRSRFLQLTHTGTDTRQAILERSFKGDESRLNNAVRTSRARYGILARSRKSMIELAGFMGIHAIEQQGQVLVTDATERKRLQAEHGRWRVQYGSNRVAQRTVFREYLETKLRRLNSVETDEPVVEHQEDGVKTVVVGPAVNIEERAVRLSHAISAMARRSMLSGFGIATIDERYQQPIYDRYENGTPRIDVAAKNKRERLLDDAKRDFWIASGFPAIRTEGAMSEFLLRRRSAKMWHEFAGQFEHPPQQQLRVKVRKQLGKYIPLERLPETKIK